MLAEGPSLGLRSHITRLTTICDSSSNTVFVWLWWALHSCVHAHTPTHKLFFTKCVKVKALEQDVREVTHLLKAGGESVTLSSWVAMTQVPSPYVPGVSLLHVHVWEVGYTCSCSCLWRQEVDTNGFPLPPPGSPTEPGALSISASLGRELPRSSCLYLPAGCGYGQALLYPTFRDQTWGFSCLLNKAFTR